MPMPDIAIDPICHMEVDTANPRGGSAEHAGKSYYFCNPRCREKFLADPETCLRPPSGLPGPEDGTSIDPICRMTVEEGAPRGGTADYQGARYYFCNPKCRERFSALLFQSGIVPVLVPVRAGCRTHRPSLRRARRRDRHAGA